jgi:phage terminase small subunit
MSETIVAMSRPLTVKQKRFIEAYEGNGAEAARKAGYKRESSKSKNKTSIYAIASENLRKPNIIKEIEQRLNQNLTSKIADRAERQQFWTQILTDESHDISARLRASELLGKSEGDFLDRIQVEQSLDLTIALKQAEQRITQTKTIDITAKNPKQNLFSADYTSAQLENADLPAPTDHDIFK